MSNEASRQIQQVISSHSIAAQRQATRRLSGTVLSNENYQQLRSALQSNNVLLRQRTAALLGHLPATPIAQELIHEAAGDPSWVVREEAIASIVRQASCADDELIKLLISLSLYDRNQIIRGTSREQILRWTTRKSVDQIVRPYINAMTDRRRKVRVRALATLGPLSKLSYEAIEPILVSLSDSHHKVRKAALFAACESKQAVDEYLPVAVKRRYDRTFDVQQAAIHFLEIAAKRYRDPTRQAIQIVIRSQDTEFVLNRLLALFRPELRERLWKTCEHRSQWHADTLGQSISPPIDTADVDTYVNDVVQQAGCRGDRQLRIGREETWFISQIFQAHLERKCSSSEPAFG